MKVLTIPDLKQVTGGMRINREAVFGSLVLGVIMAGPIGLSMAACTILMSQGINKVNEKILF